MARREWRDGRIWIDGMPQPTDEELTPLERRILDLEIECEIVPKVRGRRVTEEDVDW